MSHFVLIAVIVAACSVEVQIDDGAATAHPVAVATTPVANSLPKLDYPVPLEGREVATIWVGDRPLVVVVSDDPDERVRGLMFVTDLRDVDGMLFVWPTDGDRSFWMKDALIPLDIAWFDSTGMLVGKQTMELCIESPCRSYSPDSEYRFAVETQAGDLDFVTGSTHIRLSSR